MAPSHYVHHMLQTRCETKSLSISQTEMYAISLPKHATSISCLSKLFRKWIWFCQVQLWDSESLNKTGDKEELRPWPSGGPARIDLEGLTNTTSILNSKCHLATWLGKPGTAIFQAGWVFIRAICTEPHGTDPKQYLSLGPLSLQILSLKHCDFYKNELSSNLSHF